MVARDHRHRSADLRCAVASIQQMVGEEHLSFYDAISPIVLAESIDMSKGSAPRAGGGRLECQRPMAPCTGVRSEEGDYLNCPMTKDEDDAFYAALITADRRPSRFRQHQVLRRLPADRGDGASRRGHAAVRADEAGRPQDPRTGPPAYAVVQLRQDTLAGDHFSLVGFQTQIKWGDQARVLRMIPGPRERRVRPLRHGPSQHLHLRPESAAADVANRHRADLFFAGQVRALKATWNRPRPA